MLKIMHVLILVKRCKVGDYVRISKYKNIFAKGYIQIGLMKNTVSWTYASNDLKDEEFIGTFYEKKTPQKTNQKVFRIEKVIKKKCDKLYAKWKHHDNLFNGWIDKKDLIEKIHFH